MMPNQGLVVRATTCRRSRNAANACYSILILCVGGQHGLVVRANAADDGTAAQFNTATRRQFDAGVNQTRNRFVGCREFRFKIGDQREIQVRRLAVSAARSAGGAEIAEVEKVGTQSGRLIHRPEARSEESQTHSPGREADVVAPRDVRSDRPAADARRASGVSRRRSADAYAKVVDRLLASPRYGERWAQHWLDVVRYSRDRRLQERPLAARRVPVSRLRDPGVQQRFALRPLHPPAVGRRRAGAAKSPTRLSPPVILLCIRKTSTRRTWCSSGRRFSTTSRRTPAWRSWA